MSSAVEEPMELEEDEEKEELEEQQVIAAVKGRLARDAAAASTVAAPAAGAPAAAAPAPAAEVSTVEAEAPAVSAAEAAAAAAAEALLSSRVVIRQEACRVVLGEVPAFIRGALFRALQRLCEGYLAGEEHGMVRPKLVAAWMARADSVPLASSTNHADCVRDSLEQQQQQQQQQMEWDGMEVDLHEEEEKEEQEQEEEEKEEEEVDDPPDTAVSPALMAARDAFLLTAAKIQPVLCLKIVKGLVNSLPYVDEIDSLAARLRRLRRDEDEIMLGRTPPILHHWPQEAELEDGIDYDDDEGWL